MDTLHVNRGSNSSGGGRGPGGLAPLGENTVEDGSPSINSQSPSQTNRNNNNSNRAGGPRFAGNAAFQSAVARHGGNANSSSQNQAQAHARQISLQGRFSDLGYGGNSGIPLPGNTSYEHEDGDDAASSVTTEFMGGSAFDPTRTGTRDSGMDAQQLLQMQMLQQQQQQQQQFGRFSSPQFSGNNGGAGGLPHRRTGSDMSAMQIMQLQQQGMGGNGAGQLIAEQMAIQQQIEVSLRFLCSDLKKCRSVSFLADSLRLSS